MYRAIRISTSRNAIPVIGTFTEDLSRRKHDGIPARMLEKFKQGLATEGFAAGAGEILMVDGRLILCGCGSHEEFTTARARKTGARFVRELKRLDVSACVIQKRSDKDEEFAAAISRAFAEGMGLANWRLQGFDGTATRAKKASGTLSIDATRKASRNALKDGLLVAEATNEARRIAATPPNVCNPTWMARQARALARNSSLSCKVISHADAGRMGMGGLTNVGVGSNSKPCLIQLDHRPRRISRAAKGAHLVLVGKTMTYDSGGYSLKISNSMRGMKYDMCGGSAVFGAMHAIASAGLPIKVTALLPTAENMVDSDAYRPDDIITMYNGVTVEVTNTDAEGRLILGDALAYACRRLKPTAIVDMATLTGGVVVALGNFSAGMWCNDDGFREQIDHASEDADEKTWRLPLWQEHRDFMRSKFADILNSNPKRLAHPIQGAAFLSYFVDEDVPWAHIDIAGMSNEEQHPVTGHGPTGFGVRLLHDLASSMS